MLSNIVKNGKKFLPATLVAALIIGGISFYSAQSNKNCVTVLIDYGVLDPQGSPYEKCLTADGEVTALDLMTSADFKLEGTDKYGNNTNNTNNNCYWYWFN